MANSLPTGLGFGLNLVEHITDWVDPDTTLLDIDRLPQFNPSQPYPHQRYRAFNTTFEFTQLVYRFLSDISNALTNVLRHHPHTLEEYILQSWEHIFVRGNIPHPYRPSLPQPSQPAQSDMSTPTSTVSDPQLTLRTKLLTE